MSDYGRIDGRELDEDALFTKDEVYTMLEAVWRAGRHYAKDAADQALDDLKTPDPDVLNLGRVVTTVAEWARQFEE